MDDLKKAVISFDELLNTIDGLDDNRHRLYKEIYENALLDRQKAQKLFDDLYDSAFSDESSQSNKLANHTMHGQTLARYIERSHKSNEQLIKLSEMLSEDIQTNEEFNMDDVFDVIDKKKQKRTK